MITWAQLGIHRKPVINDHNDMLHYIHSSTHTRSMSDMYVPVPR